MNFPPFFSFKHQLITTSLSLGLLLLLLRFCGCFGCSFSSTLLLSVLPISFPFIFSKIRQLMIMAGSMEEPTPELMQLGLELSPEAEEIAKEEDGELQTDEIVLNGECPSSEYNNPVPDSSISDENLETLSCSPLEKSDCCSVPEDEASTEIVALDDDSMSDDESLIEIALEDEPNEVLLNQDLKGGLLPEFLPEFSPEPLFRKHGLMELLSEINEEDDMIEIDIAMGSIKCSRFEIKA